MPILLLCFMAKAVKDQSLEDRQLEQIGKALKQLRIDNGHTNYEFLAHDMGMARSQYGPYESGKNMNLHTLFKILNFHKISLVDFCNKYLSDENDQVKSKL